MSRNIAKVKSLENKKTNKQQKYERLLKDIEHRKLLLNNLQENLRVAMRKVVIEVQPLAREESDWKVKQLERLDEIVNEIVISKTKREVFDEYMATEIEVFLCTSHSDHQGLKNLYRKYAKEEFEGEIMVDLGDNIPGEPSDAEFFNESGFGGYKDPKQTKKRKKATKKQLQEEEDQKTLDMDAKAVYLKLIKKYHPDRQQDIEKQREYTEITKRVTKAHKENDFVGLLKLQVELLEQEQISTDDLSEKLIERYNKILLAQLHELDKKINKAKIESQGLANDFLDENYVFSEKRFEKIKNEKVKNIDNIKAQIEESHQEKKGWFKKWYKELERINNITNFDFLFSQLR